MTGACCHVCVVVLLSWRLHIKSFVCVWHREGSFWFKSDYAADVRSSCVSDGGSATDVEAAGNKIDLDKDRHVSVEEAESYAESVGAKHYHTSAKLNKGIEELFLDLCKRMMETAQAEERLKGNGASQSASSRRGVQIVDDEPQATPAGGCCSSG